MGRKMDSFVVLVDKFQKMTVLRHLIGFSLQVLPICYLILRPFKKKMKKHHLLQFRLGVLAVFCFYMLLMFLTELGFFPENGQMLNPGILIMTAGFRACVLAIFIIYMLTVKADPFYKFSLFILMANYRLILTISINIYSKLFFADYFTYTYPYRLDVVLMYLAALLISWPFILSIVKIVSDSIFAVPAIILRRRVFWLIPFLSMLLLFSLYIYVVFSPEIDLAVALFIILIYILISVMHLLLFNMVKETALRYENYVQIYALRSNYQNMLQHVDKVRKLKHETASRLAYIKLCLQEKDYAKLEEYIREIDAMPILNEHYMYTNDPFLNGIINYAMYNADKIPVYLSARIDAVDFNPLTRMEITSLLMNLLSNAISELENLPPESPREDRCIHLLMTSANDELLIACRNKLLHKISPDAEGLGKEFGRGPLSQSEHGHGLSIMRNIAEQHGGRMNVALDENFTVSIFIPRAASGTRRFREAADDIPPSQGAGPS